MSSYKIIRVFHPSQNKEREVIVEGLTLEEAKDWCRGPFSSNACYFDSYTEE